MLTPRHYQLEGIKYLTTPNVLANDTDLVPTLCRHILSDAPGAGKTAQAIWAAIDLMDREKQRALRMQDQACLVLAPAHLTKQWFNYFCEHFSDHKVVWLEGPLAKRQREAKYKAKFYIMSVQSLRHKHYADLLADVIQAHHIVCTIIDESHYCKNPDATTSKFARSLTAPAKCPHVILLTATPIMREANDLYMQLRICDPITFHRQDIFMNTYCWFNYGSWGYTDVTLRKGALDKLRPWLWGRTYKDIGLELPPIIQYTHTPSLSQQRWQAYSDMRNYWYIQLAEEGVTANSSMEAMHMLRHLTACPEKAEPLTEYMQDDPGPYLIACSYRASANFLAGQIRAAHPTSEVTVITGEVPADDRRELAIRASQTHNSVLVVTIPSISEGVDLSHCNTVYCFEEEWTPGRMHQFLSRVRRHRNDTGAVTITEDNHLRIEESANERPIIVRYFHAEKTIDQRIHAVQSNRAANAKDVIKLELGL